MESLTLVQEWDKTFPKSDKILFLAADIYTPNEVKEKLPAIAVCGPFGAVKEQCSGLYAQELASRGYLTIAFDPSFTVESSGKPRYMASPDINTEDFQAAVDFLSLQDNVDPERIGILDIYVKATVSCTMYDMTRVNANGYFDQGDNEPTNYENRKNLNQQRTEDFKKGEYKLGGGAVDPLPADVPQFVKDYHSYYKTERGYHKRSLNSNNGWNTIGCMSFMNQPILHYSNEIRNAVFIIHGEKDHSCYFSKTAYGNMVKDNKFTDNKQLLIIPDAVHTDLYDNLKVIPFDKIDTFCQTYLK
ncbi:alpha/beta superfamily hydrolase [Piromyces finnis]|uniref:Alpha/beta superfamily hydrolase n=1 Tax=Piromyces finnis TaxID=1754191 RepID=A0A1Y1V0G8_9FUNG|nr:alpha/beta superfamily hydrolase [Piromyces finnis]|eukprot:ORX44646.1 alpha/beta superfamily hydrolase [Piromyces finnis]